MDGNEFFRKLHSFFAGATQEKFEALWGRGMGKHLWEKWTGYYYFCDKSSHKSGFDLLGFIGNMDSPNREMLFRFCAKEEPAEIEIPF